MLLDAGADVNLKNVEGYTPLHAAARLLKRTAVELLLTRGANPTLLNAEDRQPVHSLLSEPNRVHSVNQVVEATAILKMLTVNGADINAVDQHNCTAYDILAKCT